MKKLTFHLLAVALALALAACSGGSTTTSTTESSNVESATAQKATEEKPSADSTAHTHTEETIPAVEPTCIQAGLTEGKRCSECGEILVEQETIPALGHTTDTGTCERCGLSFGIWETGHYVDNFNQPVEAEWYITNKEYASGTFSNSATSNSDLLVKMAYDYDKRFCFFLYEYGDYIVKNSWDKDTYSITMRTQDGVDHNMKGYFYKGADRLFIDDAAYVSEILSALSGEGEISFYMQSGRFETTHYLFTIGTSNFMEEYNKIN